MQEGQLERKGRVELEVSDKRLPACGRASIKIIKEIEIRGGRVCGLWVATR